MQAVKLFVFRGYNSIYDDFLNTDRTFLWAFQ